MKEMPDSLVVVPAGLITLNSSSIDGLPFKYYKLHCKVLFSNNISGHGLELFPYAVPGQVPGF